MMEKIKALPFPLVCTLCGIYTLLSILVTFGRILATRSPYCTLVVLCWVVIILAAAAIALYKTSRPHLSPASPTSPLADYAFPDVYADSTVTFFPEPRDYTEPPRKAPSVDYPHELDATYGFLIGAASLLCGLPAALPGLLAFSFAQQCRTGEKNTEWEVSCRRRAQAASILGLAGIAETILFLFLQ